MDLVQFLTDDGPERHARLLATKNYVSFPEYMVLRGVSRALANHLPRSVHHLALWHNDSRTEAPRLLESCRWATTVSVGSKVRRRRGPLRLNERPVDVSALSANFWVRHANLRGIPITDISAQTTSSKCRCS